LDFWVAKFGGWSSGRVWARSKPFSRLVIDQASLDVESSNAGPNTFNFDFSHLNKKRRSTDHDLSNSSHTHKECFLFAQDMLLNKPFIKITHHFHCPINSVRIIFANGHLLASSLQKCPIDMRLQVISCQGNNRDCGPPNPNKLFQQKDKKLHVCVIANAGGACATSSP